VEQHGSARSSACCDASTLRAPLPQRTCSQLSRLVCASLSISQRGGGGGGGTRGGFALEQWLEHPAEGRVLVLVRERGHTALGQLHVLRILLCLAARERRIHLRRARARATARRGGLLRGRVTAGDGWCGLMSTQVLCIGSCVT
jgi:hypothetical protein